MDKRVKELGSHTPLISIITPAYNAASFLRETLRSVQAQTFSNWELLIIDDGSTDNTKKIVDEFISADKRIKYIYQSNGRQGKARNNGLKNASGKLIAFLDADDLWLPDKLAIQIDQLETTGADLVYSDYYLFTNEFDESKAQKMNTEARTFLGVDGIRCFLERNRIPILTVLCKKESIDAVGGFTEEPGIQNAEDYHLWLKLQLAGYKFVGTNQVLAAYREHSNSVSNIDRANIRQLVEAQFDLYNKNPDKKPFIRPYLIRMIKFSLFSSAKYDDQLFFESIKRFLVIDRKSFLVPVFIFLQKLHLRKLALRGAYFVFNHLTTLRRA